MTNNHSKKKINLSDELKRKILQRKKRKPIKTIVQYYVSDKPDRVLERCCGVKSGCCQDTKQQLQEMMKDITIYIYRKLFFIETKTQKIEIYNEKTKEWEEIVEEK